MRAFLLFILSLFLTASVEAKIWTVVNSGTTFSPSSITITYGDTVKFVLATSHNAREVSLTTWNANGNIALSGGFETAFGGGMILPTQLGVGTHYYVCVPHASVGMKGTIVVNNCIIPATPGSITGATSVCTGSTSSYSISSVEGASSYIWTLPAGWSGNSMSTSISATSAQAGGTLQVVAKSFCGNSPAQTLNISVNSPPAKPGTIAGSETVCEASSNNYSISDVSNASSYTWTIPGGWTGSSNTTTINTVASATSGSVTVKANNQCGSSTEQILAVLVNPLPLKPGAIAGNATICAETTNTYSVAEVNGIESYAWSFPAGWSGVSATSSIQLTATATGGEISVTASNACGTSAAQKKLVAVNSIPETPGSITGSANICVATAHDYNISAVPGATSYVWTLPSGWSGESTSNSISVTAGIASGSLTVAASNSCGTSSIKSLPVLVSTIPDTPSTIAGAALACQGSVQLYSITDVAAATSYTWSLPSGWSGTSTTNSIQATVGLLNGSISVTANNFCGSSASSAKDVTVQLIPSSPTAIAGEASICSGSAKQYSVASVLGATSYVWTLPGGWTGSSSTNEINVSPGVASGDVSVHAVGTCGASADQTISVTVNTSAPLTPGLISGSSSVCESSFNTYSVGPVPNATSYQWTVPAGWSGASSLNEISLIAGSAGGNLEVAAINGCGASTTQVLALNVTGGTALPQPGLISGSTSVCTGANAVYSIDAVPGANSYSWVAPGGWTGSSTGSSIELLAGNASGSISVSANNTCGLSQPRTVTVTVRVGVPNTPAGIAGNGTVCAGSLNTYSVALQQDADSYEWLLPAGWSGNTNTNELAATAGIDVGVLTARAVNACGVSVSKTLTLTVNTIPSKPGLIVGNESVCANTKNFYSISQVAGTVSYLWTLPNGWTGSSATNFIEATSNANAGNLSVSAVNGCGTSEARSIAVTNKAIPSAPVAILGNSVVCVGRTTEFSVETPANATTFLWSLPAGWQGTSTSNIIQVSAGTENGTISVSAQNACGSSSQQTLALSVRTLPSTPSAISGGATFCEGSTHTLSTQAVQGADSYQWTVPTGWSGESTSNSISITTGRSSGDVLLAAVNQCGESNNATLAVTINPLPLISETIAGKASVCSGTINEYEIGSDQVDASYQWVLPEGWEGTTTSSTLSAKAGISGGTLLVKAINSCGSSVQRQLLIEVLSPPVAPATIVGDVMSCAGTVHEYSVSSVSGADSYHWILPANWTGSSNESTISTELSDQGGIIRVKAVNQCGESTEATLSVDVVSLDVAVETSGSSLMVNESNATYQWFDCDDLNTSLTEAASQSFHPKKSGHYGVMVMQGACMATSDCIVYEVVGLEAAKTNDVNVYPIPARDQFTIEVADFSGPVQFELSNLQGQIIAKGNLDRDRTPIVLHQLQSGYYLLRVFRGEKVTVQKVLVE